MIKFTDLRAAHRDLRRRRRQLGAIKARLSRVDGTSPEASELVAKLHSTQAAHNYARRIYTQLVIARSRQDRQRPAL